MGFFDTIIQTFKLATVMDVVDILIVAVLVYQLIKFVRGTSAARLLKGLLWLLIATQLATSLRLHAISYLLTNLMEIGFLALIVIFQPELRKMLERFGGSRLTVFRWRKEVDEEKLKAAIAQTMEAVSALSWSKVGALLVFEREDVLSSVIMTGTPVNAELNAQLLRNIFYPKAPLHDGAVIVSKGQIAAAGCILPLSQDLKLSKDLGTRHRAALGMSEHYDALCVVVSEETGTISFAAKGVLRRHLAPETLERMLSNELIDAQEPQSVKSIWQSIKGFVQSDKGKKQ